jgi:hypothetical protein
MSRRKAYKNLDTTWKQHLTAEAARLKKAAKAAKKAEKTK